MVKKSKVAGRLAHIAIELGEYDMPTSFVKPQALADFFADYRDSPEVVKNEVLVEMCGMEVKKAQK